MAVAETNGAFFYMFACEFLQKRDLQTGKLIWETRVDSIPQQKTARLTDIRVGITMRKIQDGFLQTTGRARLPTELGFARRASASQVKGARTEESKGPKPQMDTDRHRFLRLRTKPAFIGTDSGSPALYLCPSVVKQFPLKTTRLGCGSAALCESALSVGTAPHVSN